MEPAAAAATTRMGSGRRHPPLHTCGVAFLMIAHSAYKSSQDFNGPVGSITRKLARFDRLTSPIVCAMQYQWLTILSFSDYCILAIENRIETVFPPSSNVFNNIDKLVQLTETLPGKFDEAMNKFSMAKGQVPLLDWILIHVVSWLNLCSTKLTQWRSEEKEIVIDSMESSSSSGNKNSESSATSVGSESKGKFPPPASKSLPTTYKEALEKGSKKEENNVKKEDGRAENCPKSSARKAKKGKKRNNKDHQGTTKEEEETKKEEVSKEEAEKGQPIGIAQQVQACGCITGSDPILELFESGWLTKSPKAGKGNQFSLSSSYK